MTDLALWPLVVVFVLSAAVLTRAGVALARNASDIVERTALTALFVGMVLMAFATSLPEIVTDVTAALEGSPDLAVGDLFGSSMANMAILAVVDMTRRGRMWPSVELGHARVAAVAIGLTGLAVLGMLASPVPALGWVGVDTLLIAVAYVAALAWIRRSPVSPRDPATTGAAEGPDTGASDDTTPGARQAFLRFGGAGAVILVSAALVGSSAVAITRQTGISETSFGTAVLAVTTSLPELIASLAAARMGRHDLAVGNLFGSNAANMSVLFFADLAYTPGPILGAIAPGQALAGVGAIMLMAMALAAIVHGAETRIARFEPDALLLLAAYGALLALVVVRS